jgi:micrococcal nuclease
MHPRLSAALALVLSLTIGLTLAHCDARGPAPLSPVGTPAVTPAMPGPAAAPRAAPPGVPPTAQRARVRWISDGDTVELRAVRRGVLPQGRDVSVRLLEIDTPESKRPGVAVQCFALRAAAATERLLPRGSVAWVQTDRELHDRYGRTLGYVWNARGVFVNGVLVRRGLAKVLYVAPNDRHLDRIRAAEGSARAAGRGLWSHCQES